MNKNEKTCLPAGRFPKDFLWGAATSAYQVEGNNYNSWSEWEKNNADKLVAEAKNKWQSWQQEKFPEMFNAENYISGQACDFYNRFESDFDLAVSGGHNAHRLSIEWSRIEPKEGKFDQNEIEHYRKVIQALKKRGMEPMITLWWWTNPIWIENIGGWENKKTKRYFLEYIEKIIKEFKNEGVKLWIPGNEPGTYIGMAYVRGEHPPMVKNLWRANKAFKNILAAFDDAYDIIHANQPDAQVGLSHYARFMAPKTKGIIDRYSTKFLDYIKNWRFLEKYDFIGIQYYRANSVEIKFSKSNIWGPIKEEDDITAWRSDMDWCVYPEGIYYLLKKTAKFGKDIYISENGIAAKDDKERERFLRENIFYIQKALQEGVKIKGYFHWSLLDNFEWDKGFWPRFGLIEIDYKTLERKPRPSFYAYKEIIEKNQ